MADVFTRSKRSAVMARIRGRGNMGTEQVFASFLRAQRLTGWRRHLRVPGRPDFAFSKMKVAVFVDGCFWHGCPSCYQRPASNQAFWDAKLLRNRTRDRFVTQTLRAKGWTVLRIWEHELKRPAELADHLRRLKKLVLKADSVRPSRSGSSRSIKRDAPRTT